MIHCMMPREFMRGGCGSMALKIFNSFTEKKEVFQSADGRVGIYVCGITPYDVTHLGHAFTYTVFDVVVRYLKHLGYKVTYVQNLTDVDDDILRKAKEEKRVWKDLAEENIEEFLDDMRWLRNSQPDVWPRSTGHIEETIEIVRTLEQKGHAYARNGSVYFDIDSDENYGRLSKLSRKDMLPVANQRGNDPRDPNKKNPLDFVLWQAKKPGEPAWPSPWGEGRPGWHIECSAMSIKHLGQTFDIHGGGRDLIFPHHESSLAQAECATGQKFVRWWMHTGMVHHDGEKMSKSLGNLVLLKDLREKYDPDTIRIYLLSHHYRSSWHVTPGDIAQAVSREKLFRTVWMNSSIAQGDSFDVGHERNGFFDALDDDLNIPLAFDHLESLANRVQKNRGAWTPEARDFMKIAFSILGLGNQR